MPFEIRQEGPRGGLHLDALPLHGHVHVLHLHDLLVKLGKLLRLGEGLIDRGDALVLKALQRVLLEVAVIIQAKGVLVGDYAILVE